VKPIPRPVQTTKPTNTRVSILLALIGSTFIFKLKLSIQFKTFFVLHHALGHSQIIGGHLLSRMWRFQLR
jgi:hypothetical protein